MTQPATDPSFTPRERLRWRRAMDSLLIDAIYGRVIRDVPLPVDDPVVSAAAMVSGADLEPAIAIAIA